MTSFPKLYTEFAKYYDQLESQYRDYEKEAIWLDSLLDQSKSNRIIDVSCGTGRHLQGITGKKSEREYFAIDASKEMVSIAHERLKKRVEVALGDFLSIPFQIGSFDAALCMYWSLAGLNHVQAKKLFHEVYRILEPNGLFVFDVENAEGIKENLLDAPFIDAFFTDENGSNVIRANYSKKIEPDVVDWHAYYIIETSGVSELFNDDMKLRFYSRLTLENFLEEAGFKVESVSSSISKSYERNSPTLYFVARKI
ncbi:MAG: class I SAM-dependent DNA methyltransferase [Nitrososphaerales archaeon]